NRYSFHRTMDRHEKILQLARLKGPLLPAQIHRDLKTEPLFASAMLSELVDRKVMKLSHAKIGSSPVYFLPGQEARLDILYKYLHEKEKRAYDLLKQQRVLRDSDQEPLIRATLRAIKDFAVPLDVTLNGETEIFWRWYLISNKDAEKSIKKMLNIQLSLPEHASQPVAQAPEIVQKPQAVSQVAPVETVQPPPPSFEPEPESPEIVYAPETDVSAEPVSAGSVSEQRPALVPVASEIPGPVSAQQRAQPKIKPESEPAIQQTLNKELILPEGDELFDKASRFFEKNQIDILDIDVIRKNAEIDCVVDLPSNVGSLIYFCKIKKKKKVNDGDISSAYVQAQMKKMPILYLTPGDLTKKARHLIDFEFKTMVVRNIG
ncbi:MAG: hypothetical protein ACE5DM_05925, partial [Candidatus Nanoarchaeia archaeon]